jgi:hypothetical protein
MDQKQVETDIKKIKNLILYIAILHKKIKNKRLKMIRKMK